MIQGMDSAGIVDREAALALDEQDIIRQVDRARTASKRAREPQIERQWLWYTRLYHNQTDPEAEEKAQWQADIFIPEVRNKIETACSLIKGALLDSSDWFQLQQATNQSDETRIRFLQRVLSYILEEARFVDKYMLALREGFLMGSGCLAFTWDSWIERKPEVVVQQNFQTIEQLQFLQMQGQPPVSRFVQVREVMRNGLKIRHVPVWAMYPDPYASEFQRGKFVVEEMAVDREEIEDGVQAGIFYPDTLDKIGAPVPFDLETEHRQRITELADTKSIGRKRDLLQVYHGNFYASDGHLVLKNWRAIVANKRAVLAFSANPYYRGKYPYLWTTPIPYAGRPWGEPAVTAAASMQEELNKLMNLIIDNAMYAALSMFRKDPDKASDPNDMNEAQPGKIWNGEEGMLEQFEFNFMGNNLWPVVQFLQNGIGSAMRVSEISEGKPTSKGRATATEIQTVSSNDQSHTNNLASDLERNDLEPSVQMVFDMTLQFLSDTSDPKLMGMIQEWHGPQDMTDPVTRLQILDMPFKIRARGISMILKREEMAQKLQQALMLAQGMPLPPINIISVYYQLIQSMGLDPEQLGLPPSPQEAVQAMQMIQMQQMQRASSEAGGQSRPTAPEPTSQPTRPPEPPGPEDIQNQMASQNQGPSMPGM